MSIVQDLDRVAAVVEHQVRRPAAGPARGLLDAPLVFLLALALPGEDRDAAGGDRGRRMVWAPLGLFGPQRPQSQTEAAELTACWS